MLTGNGKIGKRAARRCLVVMLVVHAMMLAYGAWVHGPGWDEGGHLPAGISHWQLGNTDMYRVNPPLVRMVATLPLAAMDTGLTWAWNRDDTISRPEWEAGREFWKIHGLNAYWYLTVARFFSIPWSLLAAMVIYRWSSRLYGSEAGLFSAALWCFSPMVLTNAQMITPDTAAAAMGLCAAYAFWNWLRDGAAIDAYEAGLLLGLAELTKFTWVVLFVLWPLIWSVTLALRRSTVARADLSRQSLHLSGIMLLALLVINIGYGFEGTMRRLGNYRFVCQTLRGGDGFDGSTATNRFAGTLIGRIPVPVPSNYVLGIDRQKLDFEFEMWSYLRGDWRDRGWWYYYAYGLLVKEPLGYIVLFAGTISICTLRKRKPPWNCELFLLAPALVVFLLVSSQTGFNHHLRYILPSYPFVFIWMGSLWRWARPSSWKTITVSTTLASSILCSLWVFPHSHAYFNVFSGGPLGGRYYLLDSNLDWGQDILLLSDWIAKHPDQPIDGVAYSLDWLIDRATLGLPEAEPPAGYTGSEVTDDVLRTYGPQPGRYAVFARSLHDYHHRFDYFQTLRPTEVLGYTVYIYELDATEVSKYWKELEQYSANPNGTKSH